MAQVVTIDVVSGFVCPWCYVGKRRLERALEQRPGISAEVVWRPFQLNPDMPAQGRDRAEHMISIFGAERAEQIMANMESMGAEEGLAMTFQQGSRSPNTLLAHVLSQQALAEGRQQQLSEALFAAFFTCAEDIGDREVLTRLALEAGMDRATITAALSSEEAAAQVAQLGEDSRGQGITGVPFFVVDGRFGLSGAQPVDTLIEVLDKVTSDLEVME